MMTIRFINLTKMTLLLGLFSMLTFFSCQETVMTEMNESLPELQEEEAAIPNRYIVQFNDDFIAPSKTRNQTFTDRVAKQAFSEQHAEMATREINSFLSETSIDRSGIDRIYTAALSGFAGELTQEQVAILKADPKVKSIEADRMVEFELPKLERNDELADGARYQYTPCGITRACGAGNGASSGKWIWIVDTGIDLDHPDLNVQTSSTFAKSFVGGTADDNHGHGTHVAGTAAAINNTIGVIGMSAGARVVPVRVFNTGSSPTSTIIAGLNHVAMYDIAGDVVNMSLGGYYGSGCSTGSSYITAISNLTNNGTFVAAAAGNDAAHAGNYQPACVNGTRMYTVAAMDCNQVFASSYSNYGIAPVDYIAVGTSVYSTYKGGGYATLTGTSMATPHVAGIIHQRQAAPRTNGYVYYAGQYYRIACR